MLLPQLHHHKQIKLSAAKSNPGNRKSTCGLC
jgi:hypothetical protein